MLEDTTIEDLRNLDADRSEIIEGLEFLSADRFETIRDLEAVAAMDDRPEDFEPKSEE